MVGPQKLLGEALGDRALLLDDAAFGFDFDHDFDLGFGFGLDDIDVDVDVPEVDVESPTSPSGSDSDLTPGSEENRCACPLIKSIPLNRSSTLHHTTETGPKLKRKREDSSNIPEIRKSGGIYVKRRADGRFLTHVVLPKIIKSDIRRSFPQMYCNAENSHDPQLMRGFLSTYAAQDVSIASACHEDGDVSGLGVVRKFTLRGVEKLIQFWELLLMQVPDKTSRVQSARVIVRSDGSSLVECQLDLQGTRIISPADPFALCTACIGFIAYQHIEGEQRLVRAESHQDAMLFCHAAARPFKVVTTKATATMRFHLDRSSRVQSMDFEKQLPVVVHL